MKSVKLLLAVVLCMFGFYSQALAAYADTDAVVTAVNGIPVTATTAFLGGAGLGISIVIVGMIVYSVRKGIKPRG